MGGYLHLPGVAGTVSEMEFENWINLLGWQSKFNDAHVHFTLLAQEVDPAILMNHMIHGTTFKPAILAMVKDGVAYARIVMNDAILTHVSISAHQGDTAIAMTLHSPSIKWLQS